MSEQEINIAIAEFCKYQWYWGVNGRSDVAFTWGLFLAHPPEEGIGVAYNGCAGETRKATTEEITAAKISQSFTSQAPDYFHDLNAMHDAEMALKWEPDNEYCQAQEYYEQLVFICGRSVPKEGRAYGYVCHVCGEQIYDSQPTEHSESGLIHTNCPEPDCYEWHLITATAPQRAESLLRTIGKWI